MVKFLLSAKKGKWKISGDSHIPHAKKVTVMCDK